MTGRQREALEQTLLAAGIEAVDAAYVEACRGMADELDTEYERECPECGESLRSIQPAARNSMMWKHYGEAIGMVLRRGGDSDKIDELLAQMQAPVRDAEEG